MSLHAIIAKSGPTGIPAAHGRIPGSASVTLFDFDGRTFIPAGTEVAVNVDAEPIGPNHFLQLVPIDNYLCVVAEEC